MRPRPHTSSRWCSRQRPIPAPITGGGPGSGLLNAGNPPEETWISYDNQGRPTATQTRSYGTLKWTETTAYDGLATSSVSPEGRRTRTIADALGNTVKVEERTQADDLYTSTVFTNTLDGQIASITDDPDNDVNTATGSAVTRNTYDMAGR